MFVPTGAPEASVMTALGNAYRTALGERAIRAGPDDLQSEGEHRWSIRLEFREGNRAWQPGDGGLDVDIVQIGNAYYLSGANVITR